MTGVRVPRYEFLGWVAGTNEVPVGTCFQVAPGVLVTAYHVVADVDAPAVGDVVRVGPVGGGPACDATVERVDPRHDLAVLQTERPLPRSNPRMTLSGQVRENEAVTTAGCPTIDDDDHEYALVPSGGHWRGPTLRDGVLWARLQADAVMPGMSGAPVMRLADRAVVGVVSGRYNSQDDWLVGAVWVSRVEDLLPLLDGIAPVDLVEAAPTTWQRVVSRLKRWNEHRALPRGPARILPYLWPALAVAGVAAIAWLPWRWEPAWLDGVSSGLLYAVKVISLLAVLCLLIVGRRRAGACGSLVFLAGLFVMPPVPVEGVVRCGNATVVVPASMTSWANAELSRLVSENSRSRDPAYCAKALELLSDDGDVAARLKASGAPVGGIVTSDPDAVRNLDPRRAKDEKWPPNPPNPGGYVAEPVGKWVSIGRDVASVFLTPSRTESVESLPFGRSVPLARLPALGFQDSAPKDPVASTVAKVRKAEGLAHLTASPKPFDADGEPCPTGVVVAGSWANPPCDASRLARATIVNVDSRAIGVPVLGIPFDASAGPTGPGGPARAAIQAFFARLREAAPEPPEPGVVTSDLIGLAAKADEAIKEMAALSPLVASQPTHWIAVVDASLSTGRDEAGGKRGTVPPLDAAMAGLAKFAQTDIPQPGDRLSIVPAQAGRAAGRRAVEWPVPAGSRLVVPGAVARGETELPVFLKKAEKLRGEAKPANKRVRIILLTDGVNVFTERTAMRSTHGHSTGPSRPKDLAVLVIGNSRGCSAAPVTWSKNCHRASSSADDVAEQLQTIFAPLKR